MDDNTLFPGRPGYTGPTTGWFALLHHEVLCEESHDVMERVDYVKRQKPPHEIATRLHSMMYLGGCEAAANLAPLNADYRAKLAALDADYRAKHAAIYADYRAKLAALDADYRAKRAPIYADYKAKLAPLDDDHNAKHAAIYAYYRAKRVALDAEILSYIRQHIPDLAWDGKQLVFQGAR